MKLPTKSLQERTARALVRLYPHAWRQRYEEEMLVLLEDDPPGPRGVGSLVAGVVQAHVRPERTWSAALSPLTRVSLSLTGMFGYWIALSLMGVGFQKETEGAGFATAATRHPLLAIAHEAILASAVTGAGAIAVGGLPLVWQALVQAHTRRDRRLALALWLAPAALACFGALTALLLALAPGERARTSWSALAILLPWWLGGLACATAWALAPRLALARLTPSARSLRRAYHGAVILAMAMGTISVALLSYDVALAATEPRLAGESGGPLWPSTAIVLAGGALIAGLSTVGALISLGRGRHAVAQLATPARTLR